MRILIDMDGTVFNTIEKLLDIYNNKDDVLPLYEEDITEFNLRNCMRNKYHIRSDSEDILMNIFHEEGFFRDLGLIDRCKEMIDKWHKQGHEIIFVTNAMFAPKRKNSMIDKFECLQEHFPYAIPVFTPDKSMIKGDVCIDDCVDYLRQYDCKIKFLINYEFNKNEKLKYNEFRVDCFNEIDMWIGVMHENQ